MNDDCCLILNQDFDTRRILNRFQRYSFRTNFDFKRFQIEQLAIKRRRTRDLIEISSEKVQINDNQDENLSSDDDNEDILSSESDRNSIEDKYLDELVAWEPNKLPEIEFDDEEIHSNHSPITMNDNNEPTGKLMVIVRFEFCSH